MNSKCLGQASDDYRQALSLSGIRASHVVKGKCSIGRAFSREEWISAENCLKITPVNLNGSAN